MADYATSFNAFYKGKTFGKVAQDLELETNKTAIKKRLESVVKDTNSQNGNTDEIDTLFGAVKTRLTSSPNDTFTVDKLDTIGKFSFIGDALPKEIELKQGDNKEAVEQAIVFLNTDSQGRFNPVAVEEAVRSGKADKETAMNWLKYSEADNRIDVFNAWSRANKQPSLNTVMSATDLSNTDLTGADFGFKTLLTQDSKTPSNNQQIKFTGADLANVNFEQSRIRIDDTVYAFTEDGKLFSSKLDEKDWPPVTDNNKAKEVAQAFMDLVKTGKNWEQAKIGSQDLENVLTGLGAVAPEDSEKQTVQVNGIPQEKLGLLTNKDEDKLFTNTVMLQAALNKLSRDDGTPYYSSLANGVLDEDTKKAIKEWLLTYPEKNLNDLLTETTIFVGTDRAKSVANIGGTLLGPGSEGVPVSDLQKKLKELKDKLKDKSPFTEELVIDGDYSEKTSKVIQEFQKYWNSVNNPIDKISVDGVAGPQTLEALRISLKDARQNT